MAIRTGSITALALAGTGAAAMAAAFSGIAGVGADLRRAAPVPQATPPVYTPEQLDDVLREERRSPKWDARDAQPSSPRVVTLPPREL